MNYLSKSIAAIAVVGASAAQAEPSEFTFKAFDSEVLDAVLKSYFNESRDYSFKFIDVGGLRAGAIDIDSDGTNELFMRDYQGCHGMKCPVYGFKLNKEEQFWDLILNIKTYETEYDFDPKSEKVFFIADDKEYNFNGYEYSLNDSAFMSVTNFEDIRDIKDVDLTSGVSEAIRRDLYDVSRILVDSDNKLRNIRIAAADITYDGEPEYFVAIHDYNYCLENICPILLYADLNEGYRQIINATPGVLKVGMPIEGNLPNLVVGHSAKQLMFEHDLTKGYRQQ